MTEPGSEPWYSGLQNYNAKQYSSHKQIIKQNLANIYNASEEIGEGGLVFGCMVYFNFLFSTHKFSTFYLQTTLGTRKFQKQVKSDMTLFKKFTI